MMRRKRIDRRLAAVAVLALGLAACGGDPEPTKRGGGAGGGTPKSGQHAHEGTHHDLGSVDVGAHRLAIHMIGDVKPDAEVVIEATSEKPLSVKALRLWIGDATATGALKAKANIDAQGTSAHAHVETSASVPDGAKLWLSIEENDGKEAVASVDLPATK